MIIYDVSMTVEPGMLRWWEDPGPHFMQLHHKSDGFVANISAIWIPLHTGTHLDVPCHLFEGAPGVEMLTVERLCGRCRVVEIADPRAVTVAELERLDVAGVARLLLKTRNSRQLIGLGKFRPDYVFIEPDAARWLVDHGVKLVGIDYVSVDPFQIPEPSVHSVLLGSETLILEGLDLRAPPPGSYQMWCLPWKLGRGDGAPARVVLVADGDSP
jgi:arylformamidase